MSRRNAFALGAAVIAVAASVAIAKGKGILNPEWSAPTAGTYEAPAAVLGQKPAADSPWSVTTVSSSVNNNPVKGKPVTLTGEIIDYSCYLQVGKHGDKHRDCGQKCIKAGMPAGLLEKDGTIHLLMDEEHNPRRDGLTDFRSAAIENMGKVVTINGTMTEVEGQRAIYVQGFKK